MGQAISKLTIKGYKSIRNLENFELRNLNILIGPNGTGKSNFVSFFSLLKAIVNKNLQVKVNSTGGAVANLFFGPKVTEQLYADVQFEHNAYQFKLKPTVDIRLIFEEERIGTNGDYDALSEDRGYNESLLNSSPKYGKNWQVTKNICPVLLNLIAYHLHDTSDFAKLKLPCLKQDYEHLRPDAGNLAAFLLRLKVQNPKEYDFIKDVIQLAAPFFEDFILKDHYSDSSKTLLEWKQKGTEDYPFQSSQMSDGTLRFICSATALLQPNPPAVILLDEPELGLHPRALAILAGLIQKVSVCSQVIVSTQSASLIDHFQPEDIILVERKNSESVFSRPDTEKLKIWLEDYSLGDIWSRNIIEPKGWPGNE